MQSSKTLKVFCACLGTTYGITMHCKIYLMLNMMASSQSLAFLHAYFQTFSSSIWASHHLALQEAEFPSLSARLGESKWCWFCSMWPIMLTFMIDQAVAGPGSPGSLPFTSPSRERSTLPSCQFVAMHFTPQQCTSWNTVISIPNS